MNKYLAIPYSYKDKEGNDCLVSFFIPESFIKHGDLKDWKMEPDNFFGVNLKAIFEQVNGDDKIGPVVNED